MTSAAAAVSANNKLTDRANYHRISSKQNQLVAQFILTIFINHYMFRATMGPSSGETTVLMRHLAVWYAGAYAPAYQTVIHTE